MYFDAIKNNNILTKKKKTGKTSSYHPEVIRDDNRFLRLIRKTILIIHINIFYNTLQI